MAKQIMSQTIDDWLNVPAVMNVFSKRIGNKSIDGVLKFGVRLPMRPGTTPLVECAIGSEETVEGERPTYWFVNDSQSIKVKLQSYSRTNDQIFGVAYDKDVFDYIIRRKQ